MASVYHGQWSYYADTLYVTSSSGHVHSRAAYSELEEIFSTPLGAKRNRPDNPAHWYEAQLLHFGLPPTKYKATAKMRLMDAFQDGTLFVPDEILRIEDTLSRNWTKQDLEARILGPSMRPSLDPGITTAPVTGRAYFTAHLPSVGEPRALFSGALAGGAGVQGNMRSQRNDMQPPHDQTKKRQGNEGELSTRPMKAARCRGETGAPEFQVHTHINPNSETFQQRSAVIPKSAGNGRGRPALDRELQQVEYKTVPLSHQGTSGTVSMSLRIPETQYNHL
ncbi:hypothetical protein N7517_001515 [Penicillium concentricum]|uniref:Uncharacterized protein n=1 Tax=Penicillium concentricum TaxID=293559 RepID=A0A9W9VJY8_9EURO|nr:uncharacterized protein N7517_001515 [Penicillium concentricum]KAJ5383604.1 hypothetical protein N7517_001515 [Penicillium concentricum]